MNKFIITLLLTICICISSLAIEKSKLPRKMLAMYSGFVLKKSNLKEFEKNYLVPLGRAKFNVCDLKIHNLHMTSDAELISGLKELGNAINRNGMVFTAYTYAWPRRRNPQKHVKFPCFVDEKGNMIPDKFSMIHYEVWQVIFKNAFRLAEASKKAPVAAVKFDLETIQTDAISYDDKSWTKFANDKQLSKDIPASKRFKYLQDIKMGKEYIKWFHTQYDQLAERLEKELHSINPDLSLGVMPLSKRMGFAFAKKLGTKRAPVIVDHWGMYNGGGFDSATRKKLKQVKAISPNILFVPWFRINSYRPEFITCNAYHAASSCDGYSSWVGTMLLPLSKLEAKTMPKVYQLPNGTTNQDYYAAYKKANIAVLEDIKSGSKKATLIPMKKIKPLVSKLRLEKVEIPQLKSVGSGKGKARPFILRDQQIIYFNANSGESIKFEITHLAGKKRPLALQYIIFDSEKNTLRNEAVSPGEKTVFEITFPKKGTGALVVTGGTGGQAWYMVKIHSKHIGLLAKDHAYFLKRAHFYVLPSKNKGDYIKVKLGPRLQCGQLIVDKVQTNISNKAIISSLDSSKPIEVSVYKRKDMPKGFYFQDIFVTIKSDSPYLSDGSERLLATPTQN